MGMSSTFRMVEIGSAIHLKCDPSQFAGQAQYSFQVPVTRKQSKLRVPGQPETRRPGTTGTRSAQLCDGVTRDIGHGTTPPKAENRKAGKTQHAGSKVRSRDRTLPGKQKNPQPNARVGTQRPDLPCVA